VITSEFRDLLKRATPSEKEMALRRFSLVIARKAAIPIIMRPDEEFARDQLLGPAVDYASLEGDQDIRAFLQDMAIDEKYFSTTHIVRESFLGSLRDMGFVALGVLASVELYRVSHDVRLNMFLGGLGVYFITQKLGVPYIQTTLKTLQETDLLHKIYAVLEDPDQIEPKTFLFFRKHIGKSEIGLLFSKKPLHKSTCLRYLFSPIGCHYSCEPASRSYCPGKSEPICWINLIQAVRIPEGLSGVPSKFRTMTALMAKATKSSMTYSKMACPRAEPGLV
jgi:hypothetical protein